MSAKCSEEVEPPFLNWLAAVRRLPFLPLRVGDLRNKKLGILTKRFYKDSKKILRSLVNFCKHLILQENF